MDHIDTIDFLLFGYFGFTSEANDEIILDAVIRRAYRDAASHVLSLKDDKQKKALKQQATQKIKEVIYQALECTTQEDFDKWHQSLCEELCNIYSLACYKNDTRLFTYGIAQKWVNMTIKYLFLTHLLFVDIFNDSREIKHNFAVCRSTQFYHVPLDSIVLDDLKEEFEISSQTFDIAKWSQIDNYDQYLMLQKEIRKQEVFQERKWDVGAEVPITWECKNWLAKVSQH